MKIILKRGEDVLKIIEVARKSSKSIGEVVKEVLNEEKPKPVAKKPEEKSIAKEPEEKPKPTIECPLGYKFYTNQEMCQFYNIEYSSIWHDLYNFNRMSKYEQAEALNIIEAIRYTSHDKKLQCGITLLKVDADGFCECVFDDNPLIIHIDKLKDYILSCAKKIYDEKIKSKKEDIA